MEDRTPRGRRARPVSDVLVYLLLDRSGDLAKGWLLELVQVRPLERAQGLLAGGLASSGPRICEAIVRGLLSDAQLRHLEPGGTLEPLLSEIGVLVDAQAPEELSGALESLRGVIWSALRSELPDPDPELIWGLAERLALVLETVRAVALRAHAPAAASRPSTIAVPDDVSPAVGERRDFGEPLTERGGFGSPPVEPGDSGAPPVAPGDFGSPPVEPSLFVVSRNEPADAPAPAAAGVATPRPLRQRAEPLRRQIEDEVAASRRRGAPLSLLLVELDESERVLAVEGLAGAGATFCGFVESVRSAVRRQDVLAREDDTRAWVIARDSERGAARALALRIADAVRSGRPWHGAPLAVAIGVAVLGEDGNDAESLMEAAEEARFAASAAGVAVGPPDHGTGAPGPAA